MLTKQERTAARRALEATRKMRVKNLRLLADHYQSWAELGRRCSKSPTFLTAIAGPNPRRECGEELARTIEHALDLPAGFLDKTHTAATIALIA